MRAGGAVRGTGAKSHRSGGTPRLGTAFV